MSLRNRRGKTDIGHERCLCLLKPHQIWFQRTSGCQEAILKKGKRGEKTEVRQIAQELKISINRSDKMMTPDF